MSRTRLASWNYASALGFTGATLITGLVATPWLVHWLGAERFGASRSLYDLYTSLSLLELGLGAAIGPLLARALGRGDEPALQRTVAAGVRAYLRLIPLTIAVGGALTWAVPWIIRLDARWVDDLRRAWVVCLLCTFTLVLVPLRALVDASQRGYVINLMLTAQAVATAALAVWFAWAGWGLTGQTAALAFCAVLTAACLAYLGLRRHPGLVGAIRSAPPDPEVRRAIRALSVPSLILQVSGRLGLLSDNLIISAILGSGRVTMLVVTQRLATLAQTQLLSMGNACWAGLAELHSRGEHATFRRRLLELSRLVVVMGIAGLGPIVAYNRHFVRLWMKDQVIYGGDMVNVIAAVNALLQALFSLWGWCFSGTGRIGRVVAPAVVAMSVNLAASLLLTWRLDSIAGPLWGSFLGHVTITVWWLPLRLRQDFGIALKALARAVAEPAAWGLMYTVALWWIARGHQPLWGWIGLGAEMAAAALVFLAFSAAVLLSPTDRALWRARLAAVVSR